MKVSPQSLFAGTVAFLVIIFAHLNFDCLAAEKVDFNRDIRPILSENCFFCHGPDAMNREADLRLDTHAGALSMIDVGDVEASELIRRIVSDDHDEMMPPPDSNRTLKKNEIEKLKQWVKDGAEWGQHWSFQKLKKPEPPSSKVLSASLEQIRKSIEPNAEWSVHPIDRFVLKKISGAGLMPSPRASRETLIRRVSLDLTGLPPTPAEIDAFLADETHGAYERVVDRLLASPAYGERMAWNWLDVARYADSNGYQGDNERTMWPWRDWVVRSFNENMPYDQFSVWQLAGDLFPNATFEQKLATGFCRNHMINGEGGRIAEENRVDYVMDMSETTGTVWLGLTMNCCRCHDHKYDPLSQKDYYRLTAFFNQTPVDGRGRSGQTAPVLAAPTQAQSEQIAQLSKDVQNARTALNERAMQLAKLQADWEQEQLAQAKTKQEWHLLEIENAVAQHQTLKVQPDESVLASGPNPDNDTYAVNAKLKPGTLTGLRLEALRHPTMTKGGIARSDSGNFVLTEIDITFKNPGDDQATPVEISSAEATYEQGGLKVANTYDGNERSGWAVFEGKPIDRDHAAVFRFKTPAVVDDGAELRLTLVHNSQHKKHNLGRFRLSVTDAEQPKLVDAESALDAALSIAPGKRTKSETKLVDDAFQATDGEFKKRQKALDAAEKRLASARGKVAKVMVMQDMPKPRKTFLLNRGLYNKPGEEVTAGVPASLPPIPGEVKKDRLALANWIVSDENPLTARVTVNRFWQQVFGIGLVKTPEDFGVQGEIPQHLNLLNWLAADFREHNWNVKRLVKQIVMSETYRQTSAATTAMYESDPENRMLARGPRFRMPSWMIRDQALAASGLLVRKQGGPSVNGYQPPGVWEEATFGKKKYVQDHGEALYRRSLYTFWRRIIGPTMFFDTSARQTCSVKAYRTNTPLHALLTLNDTIFVEAARTLAQKSLQQNVPNDAERIDFIVRRVVSRKPTSREQEILLAGLERTRAQFRRDSKAALDLLTVGESVRDESLEAIEHASWTAVCLGVFNFDEAVTKE